MKSSSLACSNTISLIIQLSGQSSGTTGSTAVMVPTCPPKPVTHFSGLILIIDFRAVQELSGDKVLGNTCEIQGPQNLSFSQTLFCVTINVV